MAAVSSSLPLHCNVCPKKPTFSDVSHLLTHVASKGHLSHYYKLKVRASHDLTARTSIEQYDQWYDQWDVEDLMSRRMHQKDKKRSRARNAGVGEKVSKRAVHGRFHAVDLALPRPQPDVIKHERSADAQNLIDAPCSSSPSRLRLHLWDTLRPASHEAIPVQSSSPTPLAYTSIESDMRGTEKEVGGMGVDEAAKLKGAVWPGMDIFDAATPEMRRKRNQKKDVSVLDQLEKNSEDVEPTEVIYYPFGEIKKQRPISGRVESSSPELSELPPPPPPKRRTNAKHVLLDKDVNSAMTRAKQPRLRRPQQTNFTGRKRNPAFTVHRDEEPAFGNPSGMKVLTSEFRPQTSFSLDDVDADSHGGYAPPSCLSHIPLDLPPMYHNSASMPHQNSPFQAEYGLTNSSYYSQTGYDLAAFFANQLTEVPFTRLQNPHGSLWPVQVESSSREETIDSPGESFGQNETNTSVSIRDDVEKQEASTPSGQPLFDESLGSQSGPLAVPTDFDLELMQQTETFTSLSQH